MVIELDNGFLIKHQLTAKEYLILYLLYKETHHQLIKYLKLDPVDLSFWKKLFKEGWVAGPNFNMVTTLKVTRKFTMLLEKTDFFQELLDKYPVKVTRPDGEEVYLRTAQKKCRNQYSRLIKNSRIKHDAIIKCLETEIILRTKKNTLKYMKMLPNWLKDEEYKNYEGIIVDKVELTNTKTTYGDSLL